MSAAEPLSWVTRETPLRPEGVVGAGPAALALGRRLMAMDEESLSQLKAAVSPELILVLGDESRLPWARGVTYLGRDPQAPTLYVPTARRPSLPLALFRRALLKRLPASREPLAVLPEPLRVIPMSACASIALTRLKDWVEGL